MKNFKTLVFTCISILLLCGDAYSQSADFDKYLRSAEWYTFEDTLLCGPGDSMFKRHSSSLGFGADDSFGLAFSMTDTMGYDIHRFQQYYKGIQVMPYTAVVVTKDNRVRSLHSKWLEDIDLSDSVSISAEVGLGTAMGYFDWNDSLFFAWEGANLDSSWDESLQEQTGDSTATWKPDGELAYYTKYGDTTTVLCWLYHDLVVLDSSDSTFFGIYDVFVDAVADTVFHARSLVHECSNDVGHCITLHNGAQANLQIDKIFGNDYRLKNCADNIVTRESQVWTGGQFKGSLKAWYWLPDVKNTTGNNFGTNHQSATSVHWAANWAHDYFSSKFGIHGPDGDDERINIRVGASLATSFVPQKNNSEIQIGSAAGFRFSTLDLVGHEMTHAYAVRHVNLINEGETGAIGEGLADIFGTAIERFAKSGTYDWNVLGDETGGTGLRNLELGTTHSAFSSREIQLAQAQVYQGANWLSTDPNDLDNGGVHHNCGVVSKCFQMLVDGGLHNNRSVPAIGFDKAEEIFFLSMLRLNGLSDYLNLRNTIVDVTEELYGTCSMEHEAVQMAWYACDVGPVYVPCVSLDKGRDAKKYVRASDLDTLKLVAQTQWDDVTSYSWSLPGLSAYTTTDSLLTITEFPVVPAYYEISVEVTTVSDTFGDTLTLWVLGNLEPICKAGQFNKWDYSSVETPSLFEHIDVFPNPGENILNVRIPERLGPVSIEVLSVEGKIARSYQKQSGTPSIDVSSLETGVYFIRIFNSSGGKSFKYVNIK